MEKELIQYNEARARLMEDIIPPGAVHVFDIAPPVVVDGAQRAHSRTFLSLALLVVLMLTVFSAARASTTISYFNDSELSILNKLQAGILNFLLGDSPNAEIIVTAGDPDGETVTPTVTLDAGSFSLRYKVTSAETGGNSAFCNALQVNSVSGPFSYIGTLIGMDTGETTTTGPWQIAVSFPEGAPDVSDGDTCVVDLIYAGWIDGEASSNGYLDEERFTLTVHAVIPAPLQLQASFLAAPESLEITEDPPVDSPGETDETTTEINERGTDRGESRGDNRGNNNEQETTESENTPVSEDVPVVPETPPIFPVEPSI